MKIQIEIEDTLDEIMERLKNALTEEVLSFLKDHPSSKPPPYLTDLDDSGAIHLIIDNTVPTDPREIKDLWYLYGDEFEKSFENAGIGEKNDEGWPMGWKPAAIYSYLEAQAYQWYETESQNVYKKYRRDINKKTIKKIANEMAKEDKNIL
jgi:hypothetical protein